MTYPLQSYKINECMKQKIGFYALDKEKNKWGSFSDAFFSEI